MITIKKIVSILFILGLSIAGLEAQEKDKKEEKKDLTQSIYLKFKEGVKPTVYVDGKKFDFPIQLLNQDEIESVSIVKGEEAKEKFNAPNGVVLILTKEGVKSAKGKIEKTKLSFSEAYLDQRKPLIVIDGKLSDESTLFKMNSRKINSINVLKGETAKEVYRAPYGVILITTKNNQ